LLASYSRDDFRGGGGALHCFCPRAPKTTVTPLVTLTDLSTDELNHA